MQEGFIPDATYGGQQVLRWVVGKPEPSIWSGTKIAGKDLHSIQSFRCVKCGYLESYAREP